MELNVLNYFLVILGGFGIVWSFRHFSGRGNSRSIGEFEYAAFSALWGIPVFFVFAGLLKDKLDLWKSIFALPMMATPVLFILGVLTGWIGAEIWLLLLALRTYIKKAG
jgi:ABC-type Co2+ transport system permease subunit